MNTVKHWSDCSVHNGPAMEPGPCDCGRQAKAERRWLVFAYHSFYSQAVRMRNRLRARLSFLFLKQ